MRFLWVFVIAGCGDGPPPTANCFDAPCHVGDYVSTVSTYKSCSVDDNRSCYFTMLDNSTFACDSCSDCSSASTAVQSWCSAHDVGLTTGPTTGPTRTGCSGFRDCLHICDLTAQSATCDLRCCAGNCENNATDDALRLYNEAYFTCAATAYCGHPNNTGVTPCSSSELDPSNTNPLSDMCNRCLGAVTAQQVQSACASETAACANDKP